MSHLSCLLDLPGLNVYYDAEQHCLYNEWSGLHTAASIQACGTQILSCLRAHPCSKILSDHSAMGDGWHEALEWAVGPGLHRLVALGVQYLAGVPATDSLRDRIGLAAAHQAVAQPIIQLFDDVAAAHAWLHRQPARLVQGL